MHNGLLWLICEKSFHTFQPHSTIFADTNAYKIMDGTDMADGLFCSSPFWLLFSISSLIVLQAFAVAAAAKLQKSMAFFGLFLAVLFPFFFVYTLQEKQKDFLAKTLSERNYIWPKTLCTSFFREFCKKSIDYPRGTQISWPLKEIENKDGKSQGTFVRDHL